MTKELELHEIQSEILVHLLLNPKVRFAKLNTKKVPSDQFNFHLKKLIDENLVAKGSDGFYSLTVAGKEFANRFDTANKHIERQAKIGVCIVVIKHQGKNIVYLIQQRLKEPYYGFHGFVTGKVRWGDTITDTAQRELKEETGLSANMEVVGIEHKTDYSTTKEVLEDKFFFVIWATHPTGKLIKSFEGGKNMWLAESKINQLSDVFDDFADIVKMVKAEKLTFSEIKCFVKRY